MEHHILPKHELEQAIVIYDETFGYGHGRNKTVTKFISVFGLSTEEAEELFDKISDGEYND